MSNLKLNVRRKIIQTLDNLKMEVSEIRSKISYGSEDFGSEKEKISVEDFTSEHLEANYVFILARRLKEEAEQLQMLLNLMK